MCVRWSLVDAGSSLFAWYCENIKMMVQAETMQNNLSQGEITIFITIFSVT